MRIRRLVVLGVGAGAVIGLGSAATVQRGSSPARRFAEVLDLVSTRFVDSVAAESLYVWSARGLLNSLNDPYAQLFSPKELEQFARSTIGERYGGIGASIESHEGDAYIVRVFDGAPAARSGVRRGDRIVSVNGQPVKGLRLDEVTGRITGPAGTPVSIDVQSVGATEPRRLDLRRAVVHSPAVPYSMVFGTDIGYVPLQHFSPTSAMELTAAIMRLRAEGARRFVLDLRGNGGGGLDAAELVSQLFLQQSQSIVNVRHRGERDDLRIASEDGVSLREPVVVLVDGGTASASEIVAGALQDHDRALIIGTTTYGKGLVQTVQMLDGGWAVKLTTGKWYTPSGRLIQRDRRVNEAGQLVEVLPDSVETDSVRRARPAFRSDAGRRVYGGGGITPDVIVSVDTLTTPEQALLRALAPHGTRFANAVFLTAIRHLERVTPGYELPRSWSDSLYASLVSRDVRIDRRVWDAGSSVALRILSNRMTALARGDSSLVRETLIDDPQLGRAIALLRSAATPTALLALAADTTKGG